MALDQSYNLNHSVLKKPREVLDDILFEMHHHNHKGIIHTNYARYNILGQREVFSGLSGWDYSTRIRDNPDRDIDNVLSFFKRKYDIHSMIEEINLDQFDERFLVLNIGRVQSIPGSTSCRCSPLV